MKKVWNIVLTILMLIIIFSLNVYADIGPKPSVILEFEGLEKETYYITLLSKTQSTGPYSTSDEPIDQDNWQVENDVELGISAWQAFRDYQDEDGFYFIEYFKKSNQANHFEWGYYPPEVFKILLYFPENDSYLVSDIYKRYAFDSYFSVKVDYSDGMKVLIAEQKYDYTWELISLVARIAATVILELLIALCFGIKKKKLLLLITLTNVFTQCVLNILLNLFNYTDGSLAFTFHYIWMEIVVFIIEAILFTKMFKKNGIDKNWIPVGYALAANAFSFIVGMFIAHIIPGVF